MRLLRCLIIVSGLAIFAAQNLYAIGGIDTAPSPAPPHEVSLTRPKEAKLANGLRVIVAERRDLPLIAAQMVIRSGAEVDPKDRAGSADMTASLLTKGTEKMTAPQIANAIESLGGTIFSTGFWDSSSSGIVVMSDKAEPALQIFSDVVLYPTFTEEELDRLKKQALDRLRVEMQQPGVVADFARVRVVFPSGEYAHPRTGTIETLQTIGRDDIVKLYRTWYRPDNAVLVFVGDLTLEQGKTFAQKYFGTWKTVGPMPQAPTSADAGNWSPKRIVIDMPEAGQAAVLLAKPAIKRASPDYYTGLVANAALGTGSASRLNHEIRVKRGLSYGAGSVLDARRDAGQFIASAQTKNESAAEVAGLLQSELKRLLTEPVQGGELKARQALLIGEYARGLETNLGFCGAIASLATHNLPLDTLNKFIPSINAVTSKDIAGFAGKYFKKPPGLIIAGKAPAFIDALKHNVLEVKVIRQDELDLNHPDLAKPNLGQKTSD